jgi:rhodanese-related sulfurtransferase
MNCVRLAACIPGEAFVLEGGLNAWKAQGLPTVSGSGKPA